MGETMPATFSFIYPFTNVAYRTPSQDFGPVPPPQGGGLGEPPYPDNNQTELWVTSGGTQGTTPAIVHYHRGTDFPLPSGTPVLAAADGTVAFAGDDAWGFDWGNE